MCPSTFPVWEQAGDEGLVPGRSEIGSLHYIGIDLGCLAVRKSSAVAILDDQGRLQDNPVHFAKSSDLVKSLGNRRHDQMLVAVDAPRSVPDHQDENYSTRRCELEAHRADPHAGVFAGVAALYLRWYEIECRYSSDVKVIETYPRVVWKQLSFPGKPKELRKNRTAVWQRLEQLVHRSCEGFSSHQVDAVLCAYTAWCYANQNIDWFGEPGQGLIIVPANGNSRKLPREYERINNQFRRFACMKETYPDRPRASSP